MGYDIHTVCEFKNAKGDWQVAQDYVVEHHVDGSTSCNVINEVAEFRNYNLFRVLAGIHNTVDLINREKDCWDDFAKNSYSSSLSRYYREQRYGEYWPETDGPVTPVDYIEGLPVDADPVTTNIMHWYEDCCYSVTLDIVRKYIKHHPDAQQLRILVTKMNDLFDVCRKVNPDLQPSDFRLIYGFDY